MCVTLCKSKTRYYYDEEKNIKEQTTIGFNFTIDGRFIDPKDAEEVHKDVSIYFYELVKITG
jgi:hypothetical protein